MPTVDARLATLEAIARDNRERINELLDLINGGGDVDYDRSVRGRQHQITTELAAINLRAHLQSELRQERRTIFGAWQQALIVLCAVATGAASWYAVLFH
jgi:hypothetical protein